MAKYSTNGSSITDPETGDSVESPATTETPAPDTDHSSDSDQDDSHMGEAAHASTEFYEQQFNKTLGDGVSVESVELVGGNGDDPSLSVGVRDALARTTLKSAIATDSEDGGIDIPLYVDVFVVGA